MPCRAIHPARLLKRELRLREPKKIGLVTTVHKSCVSGSGSRVGPENTRLETLDSKLQTYVGPRCYYRRRIYLPPAINASSIVQRIDVRSRPKGLSRCRNSTERDRFLRHLCRGS